MHVIQQPLKKMMNVRKKRLLIQMAKHITGSNKLMIEMSENRCLMLVNVEKLRNIFHHLFEACVLFMAKHQTSVTELQTMKDMNMHETK